MELGETKRRAVYDNPTNRLQRDAERARKAEADRLAPLRKRHREETAEMQNRHHRESQKLGNDQRVEWDHHSQFPSRPANLEKDHAKAREALDKKHKSEREKLKSRHETELAAAKAKGGVR